MQVVRARGAAYVVARAGRADDVRVVGRDGRVALGGSAVGDDERDVAVLERGEVGDERVEVVGALDQDEPAGRAPGGRAVRDAPGEVGVGEDLVAGEHGGSGAEARVVEDRRAGRVADAVSAGWGDVSVTACPPGGRPGPGR